MSQWLDLNARVAVPHLACGDTRPRKHHVDQVQGLQFSISLGITMVGILMSLPRRKAETLLPVLSVSLDLWPLASGLGKCGHLCTSTQITWYSRDTRDRPVDKVGLLALQAGRLSPNRPNHPMTAPPRFVVA